MGRLRITQVRSTVDRIEVQKRTMRALGIRRMHQTVEHDDTPVIRGMIDKVFHLVTVEEVGGPTSGKKRGERASG
jgi:large subunit ribosomal protein L30